MNWEKIYAKTKRLNLFDVAKNRCAYDFLNSLRTMNLSFVFDRETILNHEMNQRKSSTSIRNILKEFRNHLRIARALIIKRATHETFVTLQNKISDEKTTDQKESEKFSNRKFENRKYDDRFCLCEKKHSFNDCFYLIENIRSIEWKSNEEIMKKIEKILETNSRIKTAIKYARKNVKRRLKKIIENENDSNDESSKKKSFFEDEVTLNVSFAETFAKRQVSYKLINCWTLDSEIDIHVCNDSNCFQLNRVIDSENQLMIDKIVHDIKNYETMNIIVKKSNESINIRLLNVALMLEFFINLICLIKIMKKKVHWDIESKRLHRKEIIFYFVKSIKNHWVLEKNFSDRFETFEVKSKALKFDLMITNKKWHEMLKHLESKIIAHLAEKIDEVKIDDLNSTSTINRCETCVLTKTHELMSRRIEQKESIDYLLNRIDYDLISMNEKYNEDFWISHFVDFYIRINFVYIHSRKNDVLSMIREFLKTTRIRYDQIVRFIRMNDERILKFEYRNFMKMRKIVTKRFALYTSFQNDKIERSEKVLMIRIRAMRIEANLSINMWSKVFKSVDYLNNRTLRRALVCKTFFETLIEKKSNLTHLQSYECRAYFLKNIFSKKNRLKSRAFIDYLVRYDFTNIFRIWIFSRMRVIRIKDVIFNKTLFYDLAKLDSKHLLIISVKETLKILEISDNIFFEMIIENKNDLLIDHLKDESIEFRSEKSVDQTDSIEKTSFFYIDMKNIYLLIFEMISNRDQRFNINFIDTMFFLQIDLKINEILNFDQNEDVQETSILSSSIENESQSQSSIKSKKNKQSMIMFADTMITNIRSRKQTYSIALTIVQTLRSYHATFSIDLKRSKQKKSNISKLHRDDLFVESRYWKQMLRHRFLRNFR